MTPTRRAALTRAGWFVLMALLGGGCDLGSKHWAEEALSEVPNRTVSVVDPWLDLQLQYNEGTAFSVVQDLGGDVRFFLGLFALLVVIALFAFAMRGRLAEAMAFGAIAGGAIGNGYDRIFRDGVIDFIKVNYSGGGSWPTFNVADALVAVGVGALLILSFRRRGDPDETAPDTAEAT